MTTNCTDKTMAGALLSGGITLAAVFTAGAVNAAPAPRPALTFEHSDFAVPGDGSARHQPSVAAGRRFVAGDRSDRAVVWRLGAGDRPRTVTGRLQEFASLPALGSLIAAVDRHCRVDQRLESLGIEFVVFL